jgi:hypothetical protein
MFLLPILLLLLFHLLNPLIHRKHLTAKAAYDTVLASEVPLLPPPNQTTVQTSANTRANGVPQCAQMRLPARGQVSYIHPNSRAAFPQSQSKPPQTQARLPVVPATDGSGQSTENVHLSHIMEHTYS